MVKKANFVNTYIHVIDLCYDFICKYIINLDSRLHQSLLFININTKKSTNHWVVVMAQPPF